MAKMPVLTCRPNAQNRPDASTQHRPAFADGHTVTCSTGLRFPCCRSLAAHTSSKRMRSISCGGRLSILSIPVICG